MSSICVWCYVICICLVSCHLYVFGVTSSVCIWCYVICICLVLCNLYVFGVLLSVCVWFYVICMCLVLCHLYMFGVMSSASVWCYVWCYVRLLQKDWELRSHLEPPSTWRALSRSAWTKRQPSDRGSTWSYRSLKRWSQQDRTRSIIASATIAFDPVCTGALFLLHFHLAPFSNGGCLCLLESACYLNLGLGRSCILNQLSALVLSSLSW